MSENVQYMFTNETPDGALVFRSKINSFGLDHVTDKDLYSFYTNFSSRAYFDTGLLPVEGSGLLAIRSALNHTQVAYQHAPGKYYINWGDHEGDSRANKYYVAQPYRIVIIDFVNGNILGARTFYSPVPITHPGASLFHTNLPNINCRGYRGNGVGWICLYHTEDISGYPFSEKLFKALERCSGVETYNDANMSETDGTRFYQQYREAYPYLWDPRAWEAKTERDGVDWTLDPDMWLEVLVRGLDDQGDHDWNGQPLTFADALFGDYKAYYTDELVPKPVNAIARRDKELNRQALFNEFKQAYLNSSNSNMPFQPIDVFNMSAKIKEDLSVTFVPAPTSNVTVIECVHCNELHEIEDTDDTDEVYWSDYSEDWYCAGCYSEHFIYDPLNGQMVPTWSESGQAIYEEMRNSPSLCVFGGHDDACSFVLQDLRANDVDLNDQFTNVLLTNKVTNPYFQNVTDHQWRIKLPCQITHEYRIADFVERFPHQKVISPVILNLIANQGIEWFELNPDVSLQLSMTGLCEDCVKHIVEHDSQIRFLVAIDKLKTMMGHLIYNCGDERWDNIPPSYRDMIIEVANSKYLGTLIS